MDVLHGIGGEEREVEGNGVLMPREGGKGREWVGCGPIVRWGRQGVAVQIKGLPRSDEMNKGEGKIRRSRVEIRGLGKEGLEVFK